MDRKKVMLLTACALFWFSLYMYIPYLTPALTALGLTSAAAGALFSLHSISQTVFRFPVGFISGKRGKHKPMVIQGTIFACISAVLMYITPNAVTIAIGNTISGYASAMYVAYTVLYGSYYHKGDSNKAMGIIAAVADVGILGAFLLGGILHKIGGIRSIFLWSAIIGAIGIVVSVFTTENPSPPSPADKKSLGLILKNKQLIASSVLGLIAKAAVFGTAWAFTTKLAQEIGAEGFELSLVNGLFITASILSSFFIATKTAKKIGEAPLCILGFIFLAVYAALIPLLKSIELFWVVSFVGGLGYSSITSIFMANAIKTLPPDSKSTGMGVYQSFYSIGSALGPIIVGALADAIDYRGAYFTIAFMAVFGAILSFYSGKKKMLV